MIVDRGEEEIGHVPLRESCSKGKNKWKFFCPSVSHPKTSQIVLCASPSHNDKKEPLFKMTRVTQAYAVRSELSGQTNEATPIKVQGRYTLRGKAPKDGWILVLPDAPKYTSQRQMVETLKWTVGENACDSLCYLSSYPSFRRHPRCIWPLRAASLL
jgi:hypothetical protein